jgi:hypothetical protein
MADSLTPPEPARHRASSTNVRPALTICTLGKRRSVSVLRDAASPIPPPPSAPTTVPDHQPSSMLLIFASRLLQFLRVNPKHSWSSMSSPISSPVDILPTSASTRTTFGDDVCLEKPSPHPWHLIPSVCTFLTILVLFANLLLGPCPNSLCHNIVPALDRPRPLLPIHLAHISLLMASDPHRPRSTRQRAPWLLTERPRPHGTRRRRHVNSRSMEARMVHSRKRHLGQSLSSTFLSIPLTTLSERPRRRSLPPSTSHSPPDHIDNHRFFMCYPPL